jgi:membrane protein implicated in regulation of membrane protease activity
MPEPLRAVTAWRTTLPPGLHAPRRDAVCCRRMSPLTRYALFQLPGIAGAALLVAALWRWAGLPIWAALVIVAAWVAKDAALYPLLRRAHEPAPEGAAVLIGRRGVARRRLAPRGTVAFGVELWRAEIEPAGRPIDEGATVRVVSVRGLTLIVAEDDGVG